ncbi:ribonuclease H-like domain-containing protein [Pyrenochaeta sp. MPI-SDFR-AT-0127]|nr:ribonuclease H-like domain-containing protein [Pyrenochaeta sp. MPI-SDFR-AT-0127]
MGSLLDPDSPHNTYGILPNSLPQTSTRAEIEALCQALKIVCDVTDHDLKLSEIKIATDSRFLVDAMSQWIEQWIEDNGMGSSGRQVAHFDVLKHIYEQLDYMEYSDDGRAREVQFWYVPREMNEADVLANKALDEAEKQASEK